MHSTLLTDDAARAAAYAHGTARAPGDSTGAGGACAARSPFPDGRTGRVVVIDDEPVNVKVVRKYLVSAGYTDCTTTCDAIEALALIERTDPDVVLLDIVMPAFNGLDLLASIRETWGPEQLPVIMLTAVDDRETKHRAFALGATDFLAKPVDPSELLTRIRNVLFTKAHGDHLRDHASRLEEMVSLRTARLETANRNLIHCLARAAELRDDDIGRHVLRVGAYAGIIARALGWDESAAVLLEGAAQLHDVGKLGVPEAILRKPDKLTPEEFDLMQKHCGIGRGDFEPMDDADWRQAQRHAELGVRILGGPGDQVLETASRIALTHHERWDGAGYPLGLAGTDIPIEGRITAVADVFDALTTKRSYKPAFSLEKSFEILAEGRGTQFDPEVLDALLSAGSRLVEAQLRYSEVK
jgi:putative two-component system response regulator